MSTIIPDRLVNAIIETSHDAFVAIDASGRVTYWNSTAEQIFGWSRKEAYGKALADLIIPVNQRQAHAEGLARYGATGCGAVVNHRVKMAAQRSNGEQFPVEMTISTSIEDGERIFFAFIHDASERQQTEAELMQLARTDMLTQLPNRRHFNEHLQSAMARVKRSRRTMAVFFMDVDHFKTVNDTLGHEAGDAVLQEFARRLRSILREVDFAARLGGDEFMVVAEEINQEAGAGTLAQKIIDSMRSRFVTGSHEFTITTSIGVALYSGEILDADTLIRRSDQAMYQAKRSGRNTFRIDSGVANTHSQNHATQLPLVQFVARTASHKLDIITFMQESLRSIRKHLGMDIAFVSQFVDGQRFFRAIDAEDGQAPIVVGGSDPLDESYCQRVVDGRLPGLIPDAFLNPEALTLSATLAVPVRAHLSVPIRLNNGEIYGTYCCFSYSADQSLNERDLGMMQVFADLMAKQIELNLHEL